ncbi:MAG: hypothetical protein ABW092_04475 [Candidatus Thiodiazotropha sp.]
MRPQLATTATLLTLLVVTFFAHQSALSAFWRFDDGWLLDYASRFSPSDYFLVPAITRGYSFNNLTPFNPLIYDLNLWLFGVSPRGFYFQHLTVMAGCGIATFLLLRIWLDPRFAFSGALLFLLGAPSLIVSQQLMVGHYLAGLMFSILAVHAYLRSVERASWRLALMATLLYMLASVCKEIYVPLPIALLFINRGTLSRRLIYTAPMFTWTLCYTLWRFLVLGSLIGGYDASPHGSSWSEKFLEFIAIPQLLFGKTPLSIAVMVIIAALVGYALYKKRLNLPLTLVTGAAVLLPMVPLLGYPGITRPDRYLFLPWWLISIITAIALANLPAWRYPYRMGISLLLALSVFMHAQQFRSSVQPRLDRFDTVYRLFTSQAPNTLFFSDNKNAYHQDTVLNGIRNALNRVDGAELKRVGILTQRDSLPRLKNTDYSILEYDQSCNCIRQMDAQIGDSAKTERAGKPGVLVVTLSPPYPPLFDKANGAIEAISAEGDKLYLKGWTALAREDMEQQFLFVTPYRPAQTQLIAFDAETHNHPVQRYRFELGLKYPDESKARYSQSRLCLLTRSMLTPVRLIENTQHNGCGGFLRTR